MAFDSLIFVLFFTVVLGLDRLLSDWWRRKLLLLIASYLFYAAWNPPFVLLLWMSTLVDWHVARGLNRETRPGRRRGLLIVSLVVNLGLLGTFKYGDFLLENFVYFAGLIGIVYQPPKFDLVLPVGISFYTFQTLSYTIDVYRRRLSPASSFLDFALYVTFFPQLVAGPIVRAAEFLPQLAIPKRAGSSQLGWGCAMLTVGLFAKTVLADYLMAPASDAVYAAADEATFADAWAGTVAFSNRIFFDFAGYTTCAIGVAMCFGFRLPDNFRRPYGAIGFSDFWRRWHVSLSTWLRDYLYIPLGGNRRGSGRTYLNVMITMLLGGLWHGASWRFVMWGGMHGCYLVVERLLQHRRPRLAWLSPGTRLAFGALVTHVLVVLTWVPFRAQSIGDVGILGRKMLSSFAQPAVLGVQDTSVALGMGGAVFLSHLIMRERSLEELASYLPVPLRAGALALMLLLIVLVPGSDRAFIYFQF